MAIKTLFSLHWDINKVLNRELEYSYFTDQIYIFFVFHNELIIIRFCTLLIIVFPQHLLLEELPFLSQHIKEMNENHQKTTTKQNKNKQPKTKTKTKTKPNKQNWQTSGPKMKNPLLPALETSNNSGWNRPWEVTATPLLKALLTLNID